MPQALPLLVSMNNNKSGMQLSNKGKAVTVIMPSGMPSDWNLRAEETMTQDKKA